MWHWQLSRAHTNCIRQSFLIGKLLHHHPGSKASCVFFLIEEEKRRLSRQAFEVAAVRTSGPVFFSFFNRQTGFSSASIRLFNKPMVMTEPAVQSARLIEIFRF